jgi:predicted transcriptional regulator
LSGSESSYRDRIYIVKDLILKLIEHNELNQTTLLSFCGLNLKKHKSILDELELNGFIAKNEIAYGKKRIIIYKPTQKGMEFCTNILEPYEKVFPRRKSSGSGINNNDTRTTGKYHTQEGKGEAEEQAEEKRVVNLKKE